MSLLFFDASKRTKRTNVLTVVLVMTALVAFTLAACNVESVPAETAGQVSGAASKPTAMPTMVPTIAPTGVSLTPTIMPFNTAAVAFLFENPEIVTLVALGKMLDVNANDPVLQRWAQRLQVRTQYMPYIYTLHLLLVGGPESRHPLIDVEEFAIAYLQNPRHYASLVKPWLEGVRASPCSATEEIRNVLIQLETKEPGILDIAIVMAAHPAWMAKSAARAISINAKGELFDDPDAIKKQYRCTS